MERCRFKITFTESLEVINSIAQILEIESSNVFVKAKTGEKLPPIGTSQAVEAEAVCLLEK